MRRLQYKKKIEHHLQTQDFLQSLTILQEIPEHIVINQLFTALCSHDPRIRWNAVLAFGVIVPRIAEQDLERARIIMRRCLWSLNDESGGIGWGVPETMAAVMLNHESLRGEYLHMLISYMREDGDDLFEDGNYLELPVLQRGLLWGIAAICCKYPDEMVEKGVLLDLLPYLRSTDTTVIGYAIRALGCLGEKEALPHIQNFLDSHEQTILFDGKEERETSLASIANTAIVMLT